MGVQQIEGLSDKSPRLQVELNRKKPQKRRRGEEEEEKTVYDLLVDENSSDEDENDCCTPCPIQNEPLQKGSFTTM